MICDILRPMQLPRRRHGASSWGILTSKVSPTSLPRWSHDSTSNCLLSLARRPVLFPQALPRRLDLSDEPVLLQQGLHRRHAEQVHAVEAQRRGPAQCRVRLGAAPRRRRAVVAPGIYEGDADSTGPVLWVVMDILICCFCVFRGIDMLLAWNK